MTEENTTPLQKETLSAFQWKADLISRVACGRPVTEDLIEIIEMVERGLAKSYSEGLLSGAQLCENLAAKVPNQEQCRVLAIVSESLRELDQKNNESMDGLIENHIRDLAATFK